MNPLIPNQFPKIYTYVYNQKIKKRIIPKAKTKEVNKWFESFLCFSFIVIVQYKGKLQYFSFCQKKKRSTVKILMNGIKNEKAIIDKRRP